VLTYFFATVLWILALCNFLAGNPLTGTFAACTALCLWTVDLTTDEDDTDTALED
jgi:hypothetical protein